MLWVVPSLFALCAGLLVYALMASLRDAEETYGGEYAADTARQFEDIFLFVPPEKLLRMTHLATSATFLLVFLMAGSFSLAGAIRGLLIGGMAAALVYVIPRMVLRIMKRRRIERFNTQLATAMDSMSNALKAGFSIQQAFGAVVEEQENPIAQEFGMFLQQLRVGMSFEDALADMDRRMGSEDLTLMIQSIEIARQTGGNLTEVFDRIAETIRERRRIEGKIQSLTAQGRIQGRVVSAMPAVLAGAMYLIDKEMMLTFFRSTAGVIVLSVVVLLEILGAVFIRRIVNIDV